MSGPGSPPTPRSPLHHLRQRLGPQLVDLSLHGKWSLRGADVGRFARERLGLEPGTVQSVTLGKEPVLACRLAADHLLLLGQRPFAPSESLDLGDPAAYRVVIADVTCAWAGVQWSGPNIERCLAQLTSLDVARAISPGACVETGVVGVHAVLIRPLTESVIVLVGWDLAEYVAERIHHVYTTVAG